MKGAEVTLSVAVTAHTEGRLLRPTLRSIAAAIGMVPSEEACELLIVLDRADPETLAEARMWATSGRLDVPVRLVEVDLGDAGSSRNAGAESARGTYLAFVDGDDLVTRNFFVEGLKMLREAETTVILHPAVVVSFGARSTIWRVPGTDTVDHRHLIRDNPWPSSSMSLRETYAKVPYRSIPADQGFGPEDWLWNIETSIAGFTHRPIPETMFFYRVREFGGVNNSHLRSILPAFDLERLIRSMPIVTRKTAARKSRRSNRNWAKAGLRTAYRTALPMARIALRPLSQTQKERLYAWGLDLVRGRLRSRKVRSVVAPSTVAALKEASELEPAISWTAYAFADLPEWQPHVDDYASILVSLVDRLKGRRAIVAVPWVGIGGADIVSLNYARALSESDRFAGDVAMLATYTPSRTIPELVPEGVGLVQVPVTFRRLDPDLQRRLLAQTIILLAPELIVSVNCFDMTNSLQSYGRQLGGTARILLTLFAFDRIGAGYPSNPITDDSQRSYLDEIVGIITDNTVTAGIVTEMLAISDAQVRVHHQPALDRIPPFRPGTRSYNNSYFSEENPFVLIWPHRLDKEKRPDSLIGIARGLKEAALPVRIEVWGQQVLSDDRKTLMASLSQAGIVYRGPYSGGLVALPTEDYHALLLTSESEGLPLVLVQSMLLGLPVIATRVGGVTDIVRDGETGLLVDSPDDIEGFVAAIRRLMESRNDRRMLIRNAYDFAVAQHGWPAFRELVEEL